MDPRQWPEFSDGEDPMTIFPFLDFKDYNSEFWLLVPYLGANLRYLVSDTVKISHVYEAIISCLPCGVVPDQGRDG